MAVQAWRVEASSTHVVRVEHGFWSGRTTIWLDGIEIYRRGFTLMDFGFVHRFDIEGVEFSLRVTCTAGLNYRYELYEAWLDPTRRKRGVWMHSLNRLSFHPAFRLACSAVWIVILALFAFGDYYARSQGLTSNLAASALDLWLSIGVGAGLGAIAILWERFLLLHRRQETMACCLTPIEERGEWRFMRVNLLRNSWLLLLTLALLIWCLSNGVSPAPALFAAAAMASAGNPRVAAAFKAELDRACETELVGN